MRGRGFEKPIRSEDEGEVGCFGFGFLFNRVVEQWSFGWMWWQGGLGFAKPGEALVVEAMQGWLGGVCSPFLVIGLVILSSVLLLGWVFFCVMKN